jgi:hypothetical protein
LHLKASLTVEKTILASTVLEKELIIRNVAKHIHLEIATFYKINYYVSSKHPCLVHYKQYI